MSSFLEPILNQLHEIKSVHILSMSANLPLILMRVTEVNTPTKTTQSLSASLFNLRVWVLFSLQLDPALEVGIQRSHAAIGLSYRFIIFVSNFSQFQRLFQVLPNQYEACLYLFECIFHGLSKYSNEEQ